MANGLIEKKLIFDCILQRYIQYNQKCRIEKFLSYNKYGHISVYCQKSINCRVCLGLYKILEYA